MKFVIILLMAGFAGWAAAESALPASAVPPAEMPDFSPPPVPEFMLRQPKKPLTLEEMRQQAGEAARKVRSVKDKPVPPGAATGE